MIPESIECPSCNADVGIPCRHIARVREAQLISDIHEYLSKLEPGRYRTVAVRADFIRENHWVGQRTFHRIAREVLGAPLNSSGSQFYIVK